MIIRQILRQQGRRALASARSQPQPQPNVTFRRWASDVTRTIEGARQNGSQEKPTIDSNFDGILTEPMNPFDSHTSPQEMSTTDSNFNDILTEPMNPFDDAYSNPTESAVPPQEMDLITENYLEFQRQKKLLNGLGGTVAPHYKPHMLVINPPSVKDVTLELLLASEAHQGHSTSVWNPNNAKYIFGVREGIHIISLEAIAAHLRRAAKVVREVSRRGGIILFVGTRPGQARAVVKAAELSGGCHLFERWIPGSITNGQQILSHCRLKVVNEFDQEIPGFEEQLLERAVLKPDLVVCLNPMENYSLLHECGLNNIPTIGIIDTNADPTHVTYPIPANDDSLRAVQVIAGVLGRAGEEGRHLRLEAAKQGEITYLETSVAVDNLEFPQNEPQPSVSDVKRIGETA